MNLYLITATKYPDDSNFTYLSAVVVAPTEEAAKSIHPAYYYDTSVRSIDYYIYSILSPNRWKIPINDWAATPEDVCAKLLGIADTSFTEWRIVCAEATNYTGGV